MTSGSAFIFKPTAEAAPAEKRKPKLFVGTLATKGQFEHEYVTSLGRALPVFQREGIETVTYFETNTTDVAHARNRMATLFLETDCTHLLFVDSDQRWRAEDVIRMLSHELPIVGGAVPVKAERVGLDRYVGNLSPELVVVEGRPLAEAAQMGTGFMLIHEDVLIAMIDADEAVPYRTHFADGSQARKDYCFFDWAIIDGIRYSEDYHFCLKFKRMGGRLWFDTLCELGHVGRKEWRLPPLQEQIASSVQTEDADKLASWATKAFAAANA